MKSDAQVVVVGAGLAGINCARILQQHGYQVQVLEASNRVGGRVASDNLDGFILDHGFQVINPAYTDLQDSGVLQTLTLNALPKGIEVRLGNKDLLLGDPRQGLKYWRGDLSSRSGSVQEKFNFLKFLFFAKEEQELGAAMRSSGSFYNQIIRGFLQGVFLANPDQLSSLMAKELLKWFLKGNPGLPNNGVQALPAALSQGLEIKLNQKVESIANGIVKTSSTQLFADFVVIATNESDAAALLGSSSREMNGSTTWYHAVEKGLLTSNHLRLAPNTPIVNSIVISNVIPSYAPTGSSLVSTTTLHKMTNQEVLSQLSEIWGIPKNKFEYIKHFEIPNSLPSHMPGKPLISNLKISEKVLAIGDYQSVPSQQGALLTGRLAAEMIMNKR